MRGHSPKGHGEASYGDNFLANMVQPDDFGRFPFSEVASYGVADFCVEFAERVGFGENRFAERTRREAAFGCFLHNKNQLIHENVLQTAHNPTINPCRILCKAHSTDHGAAPEPVPVFKILPLRRARSTA